MQSQGDNVSRDGTPGDHGVTESEMSAHKDAATLVTTVAAQTETIRQLTARVDQLENRMKGAPCEGAVQQLVGDAGAFLHKRPRPSSAEQRRHKRRAATTVLRTARSFRSAAGGARYRVQRRASVTGRCMLAVRRSSSMWRP